MGESQVISEYLEYLKKLEPDIVHADQSANLGSIAVSMKRIADALEYFARLAKTEEEKHAKRTV